ncbi:MAG: MEKHLA domain-containing protein [Verrucomicrobia bacterium]|nr:MEKHLA domain-containing protein [Verrucomicrobiota bacterium]
MSIWSKRREFLVEHGALLLRTYRERTGRHLIEPSDDVELDAQRLFEAPFVVLSGGAEAEQILNYVNMTALGLWEMDWETLTQTPSRETAEPVHQAQRAEFLRQVKASGFVDDYSGIRISRTGRRFRIKKATVWNVTDDDGLYLGQAATFSAWEFEPS